MDFITGSPLVYSQQLVDLKSNEEDHERTLD